MKHDPAQDLIPILAQWMSKREIDLFKIKKKDHPKILEAQLEKAQSIFKQAKKGGAIEVLYAQDKPVALFAFMKPKKSRAYGERVLFYQYQKRAKKQVGPWLSVMFDHYSTLVPKNSRVSVYPEDLKLFENQLYSLGFKLKYDILRGDTLKALEELKNKKNPPKNLKHLGLNIKELKNAKDVNLALGVQKDVFSKTPEHGNFSHTRAQIERDRKDYLEVIKSGEGKILGIYQNNKMMGFMGVFLQQESATKGRIGGFSFCLRQEIQGKGVATTGYYLLLQYLKKKKINSFFGGTSRPEVKGLGKIMKRKLILAHFVKSE